MNKIRKFFQHNFNPLHIYCRLRDVGLEPALALRVSLAYERYIYKFILK
ncbi:hypothetical protein KFV02_02275 [Desulfohalobiaceae bacterium Ax17]|nr:hypothetical protein [Desulfovulcanus ferrireducens]MBT8762757.1 hypothetical protein [Desulfovulcanus ferrireducens]